MRFIILVFVFLMAVTVSAAEIDNDGILQSCWTAPTSGNTPIAYMLSYTINGVGDSVVAEVATLFDSSVVLINEGDWAFVYVSSVYTFWSEYTQSTERVESTPVVSDTVVYLSGEVYPASGLCWE